MRKIYGLMAGAALALCTATCFAQAEAPPARAAAAANDYLSIAIPEAILKDGRETPATKKISDLVRKVMNGQEPLAANEASFDKYFTLYLFPLMTQYDEKSLANLPKMRAQFYRNYIQQARSQEVHDHVVQLTFRSMRDLVTKDYHPAVRYNAMLMIGDLNSKEAVFTGTASVPLPYAAALDFMLAQLKDPNQIDAVRVAALIGIARHTDMNAHSQQQYPATVRQDLIKQIAPLAMDKKVPADRSPEGHAWLRGRAVEILAALGQPEYEPPVAQTLLTIVSDSKEPLDLRFAAAQGLGRLNLRTAATLRGEEIARKLADLAVEAARDQLAMLDAEIAEEKEKLRRLSGGSPIRGEGPSTANYLTQSSTTREFYGEIPVPIVKQEQRLGMVQRVLKDRMVKVRLGLEGPDGKGGATSKVISGDYVKNVSAAALALQKVADMKDPKPPYRVPTNIELAKELRTRVADLERVAKTGGAPAPPPVAPAAPAADEGPDAAPAARPMAPAAEGPEGPDAAPAPMPNTKKAPAEEAPE